MSEEMDGHKKQIEFGFKDGFLRIVVPMELGMWNILGALQEAQHRVFEQFREAEKVERKRTGLIRPEIFQ